MVVFEHLLKQHVANLSHEAICLSIRLQMRRARGKLTAEEEAKLREEIQLVVQEEWRVQAELARLRAAQ